MTHLPFDHLAEQAVLGSALMRVDALSDVAHWLQPADFYDEQHRQIYDAMLMLSAASIPVDLRTLSAKLRQCGNLATIGGLPALSALCEAVPTSHHIEHYGRIVQRCAILRRLIAAGGQIAQLAVDTPDVDQALALAAAALQHIERAAASSAAAAPARLSDLLAEDLPPVRWIIPGVLPEGFTLLAGRPKLGKSWLAQALALAVASGGRAMGQIEVQPGGVLYLALEDNKRRLKARTSKLLAGQPADDLPIWVTCSWPTADAGGLARLRSWLDSHTDTRLVVIDTIAKIRTPAQRNAAAYDADYREMAALKSIADDYGIALVGLHHQTKAQDDDALMTISGSTGLIGAVDGFLVLQRQRGATEASLYVVGRDIEQEQEIALLWDAVTASWTSVGNAAEYRLTRERQSILDALVELDGPAFPRDLADMLLLKRENVYQLLRRMASEGQIVRTPDGRYSLPGGDHDRHDHGDHGADHGPRPLQGAAKRHHDHHDRHDRPKQHDPQIMPIMSIMDHGPHHPGPAARAPQSDPGPQYARVNWQTAALLAATNTPAARARLTTFCDNWGAPVDGVLSHIAQMQGAQS